MLMLFDYVANSGGIGALLYHQERMRPLCFVTLTRTFTVYTLTFSMQHFPNDYMQYIATKKLFSCIILHLNIATK